MKGRRISAQISAQVYCVLDLRHSPSLNCLYRLSSFNCSQKQQKPRPPYKRIKSWGEVELKQKKSQTSDVCLGIYVSAQKPQIDYNLKLPQRASNATILKLCCVARRKWMKDDSILNWTNIHLLILWPIAYFVLSTGLGALEAEEELVQVRWR